jgi:predicted glycoside hydrolase/deacetylase ChbG (UPF0249 family)
VNLHITCDDCGFSEAINTCTLELAQAYPQHPVSASVIANFQATDHALHLFRGTRVNIGAHLNLNEGQALTGAHPALTDSEGRFRWINGVYAAALRGRAADLAWIEGECRAQIEAIAAKVDRVEHLSTHMHFQIIPVIRDLLMRLARRYDVLWIRASALGSTVIPRNPLLRRHKLQPHIWLNALERQQMVREMDYLAPILYWMQTPPAQLRARITALPRDTITEVVVHPDTADDAGFPRGVGYSPAHRAAELRYLREMLG